MLWNRADLSVPASVTIVCITYSHEDFIRDALDSFLMQQTTFRYQIFVGEDCGPDGTAEIVRDYAERYPGIVIPFIRETNMGAQRNLVDLCQQAGTEYIAFCEGDDFWTDEEKLQKQFDLMEANPDYSACFHNTRILSSGNWYLNDFYRANSSSQRFIPSSIPLYDESIRVMRMGYYIRFGPAHTSSMFFRWNYNLDIPDWYYSTIFGDHPMMMMQVGRGKLAYIPQTMSVYRRHAGGAIMNTSKRDHHLATRRDWLVVLEGLASYFRQHYGRFAETEIVGRMVVEMRNFIVHASSAFAVEEISTVIQNHPLAFRAMIADYAETSRARNQIVSRAFTAHPNGMLSGAVYNAIGTVTPGSLARRERIALKKRVKDFNSWFSRRKKSNVWLFMTANTNDYQGNVRAMFEYVQLFHSEVEAHWLTTSKDVRALLNSEGMNVCSPNSRKGRRLLLEASVLFVNSLRADIFEFRGFNRRMKIVRLVEYHYLRQSDVLVEASAIETLRADDPPSARSAPKDWRSSSNLVVVDSGLVSSTIESAPGSEATKVLRVSTEPRLLSIHEPLFPRNLNHVLFAPGELTADDLIGFPNWLRENLTELSTLAKSKSCVIDIYLPFGRRVHEQILDVLATDDYVQLIRPFDVCAHFGDIGAAAVSAPDNLTYSLIRHGVPVSVHENGIELVKSSEIVGLLPQPIFSNWVPALKKACEAAANGDLKQDTSALLDYLGVIDAIEPQSMAQIIVATRTMLEEQES